MERIEGRGSFADRLADAIRRRRTPALVGLDPRLDGLPAGLQVAAGADWQAQADAVGRFCRDVIDVVADLVPAVKPQMAFFEMLGPAGMLVLHQVIEYARQNGLLVIVDGKRNDIGTTAEAYAGAYLDERGPWRADALTVNPYMGLDTLEPFVQTALRGGNGLFVLTKTSNPGSAGIQDMIVGERTVAETVAGWVEALSSATPGACGYGPVGAVAGATFPEQLARLRAQMPHAWLLVPGFGSQGGTAADVRSAFDGQGLGALVNSSRDIIFAWRRREFAGRFSDTNWQDAVHAATLEMIERLRADTPAARLALA